ncbi:MAG: hypothetical protein IKO27_02600 [Ruminococcus sp.]|nr:hypothetical protein [Ruminococcus sp.]
MKTDLKKFFLSLLIWSAVNAGIVIFFASVIGNVTAEVAASAVTSLSWVLFAVICCRKRESEETEV